VDRRAFVAGSIALLAAPLSVEAQAGKVYRLGVITPGGHSAGSAPTMATALPSSLRELGRPKSHNRKAVRERQTRSAP